MITACFARAPQGCTSRIYMHFIIIFQKVRPIIKTRNQLMLKLLGIKVEMWALSGYDTFAGESYPLARPFFSERAVRRAAKRALKRLEQSQPSRHSGGQQPGGIQDHIYVVRPDGSRYRYTPEPEKS